MKRIVRGIAYNAFSLFLLTQLFSGVKVFGGFPSLLFAGFSLSIISFFLNPLLKIIAFPLNIITFGSFTIVINAIILYILTLFVKDITISPFVWHGISLWGFVIPAFAFGNYFFAYLVVSLAQMIIKHILVWITTNE